LKKDYGNYYTKLLKEIMFSFVPIEQTDDILLLSLCFIFQKALQSTTLQLFSPSFREKKNMPTF